MRIAHIAIATTGIAVAIVGCSTNDAQSRASGPAPSGGSPSVASGTCAMSAKFPASPTVSDLKTLLDRGLDPALPAADKVKLVQGAQADPEFLNRVGAALQQANFKSQIKSVADYCDGTANADVTLTINGQTTASQVPLVAEDGVWKLDRVWGCGLASSLGQSSSVCA